MKNIVFVFLLSYTLNLYSESLTLWHAYRGKEKKALEIIAENYQKENNVKINLLSIPYDAFDKKLSASIPRNQGPDLFIFANDKIGNWAKSGLIENLNFYFHNKKRLFLTLLLDNSVKAMVYEGKLYAVPLAFKVPVLYYNKKYIKNPPKTFKELIKISKEKMEENKNLFGFAYENTNFFFHSFLFFAFGGKLFKDKEILINSVEAEKSLRYALFLSKETNIMPQEITSAVITTLFNKNQLLFVINGPWFSAEINKNINYEIAPIPDIEGMKAKPYMSNEGIFINKYSDKKNEAIKFIRYIAGKKGGKIRMKTAKQTVCTALAYKESDSKFRAYKLQAENSVPIPNSPIMNYFWAPMNRVLKKVLQQNTKPKEALKEAEEKIKRLLSK